MREEHWGEGAADLGGLVTQGGGCCGGGCGGGLLNRFVARVAVAGNAIRVTVDCLTFGQRRRIE